MSGQLKRCNESSFDSLLLGGWQGLFCVGRSGQGLFVLSWESLRRVDSGVRFPLFYLCQAVVCLIVS